MTIPQAVEVVKDVFFETSNKLYDLNLPFEPLPTSSQAPSALFGQDVKCLQAFLSKNPSVKFLRLQYEDYTATSRLRVIPVKKALQLLTNNMPLEIGITKASLGLLQNDTLCEGVTATGEYRLQAILDTLRLGPYDGYALVQGEFREVDGTEAALCPRSLLRRTVENAKKSNVEFLLGFEIEIVFLSRDPTDKHPVKLENSYAHAWSSARGLHRSTMLGLLNEIYGSLCASGINLEQWHPEGATGQYEFVLPPLPPLESVDTLIHAREIIATVAADFGLRATLHPKPFPDQCGTAAHAHLSISSPIGEQQSVYESFYQGVLNSLNEITAFTYSNRASYDRVKDGFWAGGRWVAWGTQNRETPLRKIKGSHWEIKCIDGLANMYLAIAAIIAAGTQGVKADAKLVVKDCLADPATLSEEEREELGITSMNESLQQALEELGSSNSLPHHKNMKALLGEEVIERYIGVKTAETELLSKMGQLELWRWIVERY